MGRAKKSVEVEAQVIARGNIVPMMTETESEETVQYVSDEDAAREDRLVSEIRMITEQTKQVVLFNSIEIGRRLTEAKAMVKRGTWGTWLKERVDYSQRTANNFVSIRHDGEDSGTLSGISHLVKIHLIVFQQFAHLLDSHRGHAHVATDDDGLQRLAGGYFEHLIVCQCEILIGRQSAFTCRRQSVIVTLHEA